MFPRRSRTAPRERKHAHAVMTLLSSIASCASLLGATEVRSATVMAGMNREEIEGVIGSL